MKESDIIDWLYDDLSASCKPDQTMGDIEKLVEQRTLELRRQLVERLTQDAASREELGCPDCGRMLNVLDYQRWRTVYCSFGKVRFVRQNSPV